MTDTNVKYATILKDHTVVLKRNKQGVPRVEKDFKAGPNPIKVTRAQLEALVAAGAGEETSAPTAADSAASTAQTGDAAAKTAPAKK